MQDLVTCNVNQAGIKEGSKDEDRRKQARYSASSVGFAAAC